MLGNFLLRLRGAERFPGRALVRPGTRFQTKPSRSFKRVEDLCLKANDLTVVYVPYSLDRGRMDHDLLLALIPSSLLLSSLELGH